jgi:hypothetical protein
LLNNTNNDEISPIYFYEKILSINAYLLNLGIINRNIFFDENIIQQLYNKNISIINTIYTENNNLNLGISSNT